VQVSDGLAHPEALQRQAAKAHAWFVGAAECVPGFTDIAIGACMIEGTNQISPADGFTCTPGYYATGSPVYCARMCFNVLAPFRVVFGAALMIPLRLRHHLECVLGLEDPSLTTCGANGADLVFNAANYTCARGYFKGAAPSYCRGTDLR
jgi:hypothetical protein